MKLFALIFACSFFVSSVARTPLARAEGPAAPTVNIKNLPVASGSDESHTITVERGRARSQDPEFRIETDSEEIQGEPVAGKVESYNSWKKACDDWKKEMREMNGKALISLNCGKPKLEKDSVTMLATQTSVGTYKLKVRVKDSATGTPSTPKPEY